jgi:CubicO group peptidase (beta-lactamase class C family)
VRRRRERHPTRAAPITTTTTGTTAIVAVTIAMIVTAACGSPSTNVAVPVVAPRPTAATRDAAVLTPTSDQPVEAGSTLQPVPQSTTQDVIVPASTTPPVTAPPSDDPPSGAPGTTSSVPRTSLDPAITLPRPVDPPRIPVDPGFGSASAAFDRLTGGNVGASMTIVSGGAIVFGRASGQTIDGQPATSDSPMVVASVSKIIVATAIARLQDQGLVDVAAPVPWADLGFGPHLGWIDVTIRELLDHRSGLSKARSTWFTGEGSCRDYIPSLLTTPPNAHRGQWVYSNGNYCLLGLLVEQRTGLPLDQALQRLVFDPVGAVGIHLTDDGLQPGDLPYEPGVNRLSRLGGAGTLIVSTDDVAMLLGRLTPSDRWLLQPPGVFTDQYGFGHTGTVDFAKSCVWLFDGGTTVVSATISGESVGSGGDICDIVVPAVATDLGINQGPPDRTP